MQITNTFPASFDLHLYLGFVSLSDCQMRFGNTCVLHQLLLMDISLIFKFKTLSLPFQVAVRDEMLLHCDIHFDIVYCALQAQT